MVNKKLPLIAIALVVFLGVMFLLGKLVGTRFSTIVSGPGILAPNVLSAREDAVTGPTARLTKESGVVSYKLPDANEFQQLDQDEVDLPTGTEVKTGPSSFAHVIFPDNSLMSLSTETQVTLNFEANTIKIFQLFGNTWHRVERVIRGSSYEVETPNTLATVRGTEFNVGVLPNNESEIYVVESVVDVSKIAKDQNGEMTLLETEKVTKDKHITVPASDSAKKMQMITMSPAKKNTDWFKRNEKLTEVIKKTEQIEEQRASITPTQQSGDTSDEQENKRDQIKHNVRMNIMKTLKDNDEIKKVDRAFPTNTPAPTSAIDSGDKSTKDSSNTKSENSDKSEKNDRTESQNNSSSLNKVLGAKTVIDTIRSIVTPTATPGFTPIFRVKPTAQPTAQPTPEPTALPTATPATDSGPNSQSTTDRGGVAVTQYQVVITGVQEGADSQKIINVIKELNPNADAPRKDALIGFTAYSGDSLDKAQGIAERLKAAGAVVDIRK